MQMLSEEEFLAFLSDALMYNDKPLKMAVPFPTTVYDSTGALMLAMAIEEKFGKTVSMEDLAKLDTPGKIYDYLRANL